MTLEELGHQEGYRANRIACVLLSYIRKESKLTNAEIGKRMGRSLSSISSLFSEKSWRISTLARVLACFGKRLVITVEDIND